MPHSRERILPNGCVQIILNLARDFILDCPEGQPDQRLLPALVVGARSSYEIVDTSDMADLIGIQFEPGGFAPYACDSVDRFSGCVVSLENVWGAKARAFRDRLREVRDPQAKLACLEAILLKEFHISRDPNPMVAFALATFAQAPALSTVKDVSTQTGWSERRFSQIFREEVGLTPKVWCRVQRFQRAVALMRAGTEVAWAELALSCGYYDQSHFVNEFHAFSGINPTSYTARRTRWGNHLRVDSA
jgi:AraC-like DNA-binding protein